MKNTTDFKISAGNHGPILHLNAKDYKVKVDGNVKNPLELSIEDLKTRFPQHEITSALKCAGNRRYVMRTLLKEVNGLDWFEAAVMNCKWRGPKLRDILNKASIDVKSAKGSHVAFACYKVPVQRGRVLVWQEYRAGEGHERWRGYSGCIGGVFHAPSRSLTMLMSIR